jgi:hypothetical protein
MPIKDEGGEIRSAVIATIIVAIGAFCLWFDLRSDALGHGDGNITSAVVYQAGATTTPSEPAARLIVPLE